MSVTTKTYTLAILMCLLSCPSLFSAHITIVESRSYHALHKMDLYWQQIAHELGHQTNIISQSDLDDPAKLQQADILILSSGLISLSAQSSANIKAFVQQGGNAYLQSEYLPTHPGNLLFQDIVNSLGGHFAWEGNTAGSLTPMNVSGQEINSPEIIESLTYFWYGTYGSGDEHIIPILEYNNENYGFIFCPSNPMYGKVITISDQDWIRAFDNPDMLRNIVHYLAAHPALSTLPEYPIQFNGLQMCDGQPVTFSIDGNHVFPILSYQWFVNGLPMANAISASYSSTELNNGDIVECQLSMAGDCAPFGVVSNPIIVEEIQSLDPPQVDISSSQTTACEGELIIMNAHIDAIEDASNIRYQWLRNGDIIPNEILSTIASEYFEDQDQISFMFIYDTPCATDQEVYADPVIITIIPAVTPFITIIPAQQNICTGQSVSFSLTGNHWGSAPIFDWQIDGQSTGVNSPVFSSNQLQNGQTLQCFITSDVVCATAAMAASEPIVLIVSESFNPAIAIEASSYTICAAEPVSFTAIGNDFGDSPSFQWLIDGQPAGTDDATFTTTDLSDQQQVSYILNTSSDCTGPVTIMADPVTITVSAIQTPTINITADQSVSCDGSAITFTATGENLGNNPQYIWMVDGQPTGHDQQIFYGHNLLNGQLVSCKLISDANCLSYQEAISLPVTVQISNLQLEVLEVSPEHCNMADGLIEVEVFGGAVPYEYSWSNGADNSLQTDLSSGIYLLTVTDANGCSKSFTVEITSENMDIISDLQIQQPNCYAATGSATVFVNDIYQEYTYEWTNEAGEVVATTPKANQLPGGIYQIAVTNAAGCTQNKTVILDEAVPISFTLPGKTEIQLNTSTKLIASLLHGQPATISWFPADGLSCTDCLDPIAAPTESTVYTLTLTSESGCTFVKEIFVHVLPNQDVFIPNAFTPNEDGQNDFFTLFGGGNVAKVNRLQVFDRWGAVVFDKTNFDVNIEAEGWDGRLKGKQVQQGVFIYLADVQFIDNSSKLFQGDISITP